MKRIGKFSKPKKNSKKHVNRIGYRKGNGGGEKIRLDYHRVLPTPKGKRA